MLFTGISENIAFGRPAWQDTERHHARRAVDGNDDNAFASGSCTHSEYGGPGVKYWAVDLGQSYWIKSVRVVNRKHNCCSKSKHWRWNKMSNIFHTTFRD